MKLAEALRLRKDLQTRIAQIGSRLCDNAHVQEGEKPSEEPLELLKELDECSAQLEELITKINLTNACSEVGGKTLTAHISHRDVLVKRIGTLRGFLNEAAVKFNRYSKNEIKIFSTVDVKALQKELDGMSKELRETDTLIQQANWNIDLLS